MRQHLRVLSALLEREQYGEMQKYLCRYTREFQERLTYHSYCKNQVADAILHYYEELCRKNGIVFQCQVEAPEKTGIQDTDFCRLFGNLLENAIEAAQLCPKGSSRFVRVQIRTRNNKLLIKEETAAQIPYAEIKQDFFQVSIPDRGSELRRSWKLRHVMEDLRIFSLKMAFLKLRYFFI